MNAITQAIKINLIPGAIPPRINVSQYDDESRTLSLALYNGTVAFTPGNGTTAQIQGTKPDGKGFQYDATITGSTVTATVTQQMAAVAGDVRCEIVIKDSTKTIATGNFILVVEQAALGEDTDISETVLPAVIDAAERNAERAEAAAEIAEAADLHPPYIGDNDNWYVFDVSSEQYVDSGVDARGDDGTSIANIAKTSTSGLVDTYTVTLTDGTTYTFTVTNGANGQDGEDGEDGVGIADIEKTSTVGLVDTYTITLTDQTTYTFTVTNGTSAIPGGGTTGQVLTKLSDTSGDAGWQTPASGSSSLAGLTDTTITTPTDKQPLTYDNTTSKWVNGGVIQTANGGTGNAYGYIRTGQKANTTIGGDATAEGIRNTASGNQSHAEGADTVASNTAAHAEGSATQATGVASHAEGGGGVVASGMSSHAEGASTQASAHYSHAEGQGAKAQGLAAHAQNFYTTASANYSSAAGYYTTAGYQNQFVVGKYNDNKSTNIFEVGIGTASNAKANGLELDTSGNLKTAGTITDGNGNVLGGSSGNKVFTWDSQYTDASTSSFAVTLSEMPSFSVGDVLVLKIHANLTYSGSGGWGFLITVGSSSEGWSGITKRVSSASGYDVSNFADNLTRGTCLTFICTEVSNNVPTLLLISKESGGAMEQTVTLSTSADTTVTFTRGDITTDSCIEVGTSVWGIVPSDVTVTTGVCTVTIPKADSAQSIIVRIYVR